ncbi:Trigger factor [Candidatus Xenohaliotis californiensis]|uniref:Trigger factor n=1 Tax=Candidatus Xenohaliotis californiensis TaxID=84677 RepID=A0ABP0EVQ2_9RICK|nr:Trigger factor [Candidatus Xenohaliotis californiensis]
MVAYSLKELSNDELKYEYRFHLIDSDINSAVDDKVKEYSAKIRMPGFRVGKVSPFVVRQKFGADIRKEVVESAFKEVHNEIGKRFNLATNVDVKLDEETEGNISATLTFEVLPAMPKIDLSTINVTSFICEVKDADVDKEIEIIKKEQKNFIVKAGRKALDGDAIDVDFEIFVDNKLIKGGEAKNYRIVLGNGQMIKGFEDGLQGMEANENKTFDFVFPDDYQSSQVAGKKAKANVKVLSVLSEEEIISNDDLAKVFNCTQDEIRVNTKASLHKKVDTMIKGVKIKDLFDALDEKIDCPMPKALLDREEKMLLDNGNLGNVPLDIVRSMAARRVKIGLFLMSISNDNGLKLSNDDLTHYVMEQVRNSGSYGRELLDFYMNNEKAREAIARSAMEEKGVNFVLTKVLTKDEEITFSELQKKYDAIDNDLLKKSKAPKTIKNTSKAKIMTDDKKESSTEKVKSITTRAANATKKSTNMVKSANKKKTASVKTSIKSSE